MSSHPKHLASEAPHFQSHNNWIRTHREWANAAAVTSSKAGIKKTPDAVCSANVCASWKVWQKVSANFRRRVELPCTETHAQLLIIIMYRAESSDATRRTRLRGGVIRGYDADCWQVVARISAGPIPGTQANIADEGICSSSNSRSTCINIWWKTHKREDEPTANQALVEPNNVASVMETPKHVNTLRPESYKNMSF